jgi:hypothetical protein
MVLVVAMVVMMMKRGRLWMRKGRLWNGNRDRKMDASDGRTRGTRDEARLQPWDGARTAAAAKSMAAADKGTAASRKGKAADNAACVARAGARNRDGRRGG